MSFSYPTHALLAASRWSALGFAFFLPISTALMNVFLGLTLLCAALTREYWRSFKTVLRNPFVITALLLFGLFALGVLYSPSDLALVRFEKYYRLLLPLLLLPVFLATRLREEAVFAFLGGMTVVMVVIYAMVLGLVEEVPRGTGGIISYSIDDGFKTRIITGIFMAFAAYGFVVLRDRVGRLKPLFLVLAALAALHVLVLSAALTSRLVLLALIGLMIVHVVGMKRGIIGFLLLASVALPAMYFGSDSFRERIENMRNIGAEVHQGHKSSVEQRLEYLQTGIAMVRARPLVGHGTGAVIDTRVSEPELLNLHNQYLMAWAEVGILGLGLLLYLFYTHWRLSTGLPEIPRRLSQGVLTIIAVGCLFNSFIMDSGEGHFYFFFTALFLAQLGDDRSLAG